jgi:hypothetical protein
MEGLNMCKTIKVIKNDELITTTYNDICHELGFSPEIAFIKITNNHKISFWCGRPQEIIDLYNACKNKGYAISEKLKKIRV